MFIATDFKIEEDMMNIIEESFDKCISNREEIYWLISLLRCFMNIKNKRTESNKDNFQLNLWQYEMFPKIERFKRKYNCSTYLQGSIFDEEEGNRGGAHWWNNGVKQVFSKDCPSGFKAGMLKKSQRLKLKKRKKNG